MNTLMMRKRTVLLLTLTLALAPTVGSAAKPTPRRAAATVAAQATALGSVIAWGLADDPTDDLTPPADLGRVKAIAVGDQLGLALKADGRVAAWGNNSYGALNVPPGLVGVKAIATMFDHCLALKADGTVIAWGRNDAGQTDVPAGLNNVLAIAAGSIHSLALKADGTVVAWGVYGTGIMTPPAGLNYVTAIAAGNEHSLALKEDGTVVAWGSNSSGQLNVPAGLSNVVAIAAGYQYSLALKEDGTVVAWGSNIQGESDVPAGLNNVAAISGGLVHSLALKADGTVVAWGLQELTRLPDGLRNVTAIAAGFPQSLALVAKPLALTPAPGPLPPQCSTTCFRSPQYYLDHINQLPQGRVVIAGEPNPVSTRNIAKLWLALRGGQSTRRHFNQQFVAAQLSLLAATNSDGAVLQSRLSCYNLNFAPVQLSSGTSLSPNSSLNDLLELAKWAARDGRQSDLRALSDILDRLNSDDPRGECGRGEDQSFSPTVQQALDDALAQAMAEHNIPGAVVGLWIPGEGSWVTTRGVSDLATGKPMGLSDHFRIGSNTKTFTTTAILQLADGPQPKLRLDDTVDKYLPFVPNGDHITIRMLANMTSGLASYTESEAFFLDLVSNPQRVWTPRELVDIGLQQPPHFAPGEGWHYSNTNTVLLGLIIELVTGQSVQRVFEERIFNPLGLRQTSWPTTTAMPEPFARGYTEQTLDGKQADATNWNPSWGFIAGQLISDLADMKIWARALGTGSLLSREMQAERLKWVTYAENRRYGLGIGYDNGWLGHIGTLPGYNTSVFYLPEKDVTLVVLTNSDIAVNDDNPAPAIFKALTRVVTPDNVPQSK